MSLTALAALWLTSPVMGQAPDGAQFVPDSDRARIAPAADESAGRLPSVVVVSTTQPTSLPTQIPTTMEGIDRLQIEQTINATDSEDALKYFPSLLVRKRYAGDYNHAILSSRASGTGNSARSMVYGDGILLSNYLGNGVGGLSYVPRWGLVTPEEIDRVDVMYGPFSAAYPGNSMGAVVDYVTRMPTAFEGHVAIGYIVQPFDLYSTQATYRGWQTSASLGSRQGEWSWWINVNRTDSQGQPLSFATRLLSAGALSASGTPVTGAVLAFNNANQPWYVLGTGTQYHTVQDHAKLKLAYDFSPTLRATYTLGIWQNDASGNSQSYLRNASGQTVYGGPINLNGLAFTGTQALNGGDFPLTQVNSVHAIHGLTVRSNTQGLWDWEAAASLYTYNTDTLRQNAASNTLPGAASGGSGTIANGAGSGWNTLALRGTWRPEGIRGEHIVDVGVQQYAYQLRYLTSQTSGSWIDGPAAATVSNVQGDTVLRALWGQDTWAFAPRWKTVLGARLENWQASNGSTSFSAISSLNYPTRNEQFVSPKAAISNQITDDTLIKGSVGRAVRFPTPAELYGATSTTNSLYLNDPNLAPEKAWTGELTLEKLIGAGTVRLTWFAEQVTDALYSQTVYDSAANKNITRVQNVGRIVTNGLELVYGGTDIGISGLDLNGSVTYADSVIRENNGFVTTPGDTVGKRQPNIPRWRATVLGNYRFTEAFSTSLGVRYSGQQYRTLNNIDVNGYTYQGVSPFVTADVRALWRINKTFTASIGIDNLNSYQYWNFHPYPQRTYMATLRADTK
jgi:iron complex outermembrane receptor protein